MPQLSEWLQIMLAEIARKQQEERSAAEEQERRRAAAAVRLEPDGAHAPPTSATEPTSAA